MSTLAVTTISSNAATDDFTIQTSNTDGPQIVLYANGYGVLLKSNSTSNNVLVNNSINYLNVNTSLGNFTSNGQILLTGVVTPTVISSNTSAWNPGTSNVSVIRLQANSSVTSEILLSGLTAGTNGQVLILSNIGTKAIIIRNEDSANESTAGNRFNLTNHTILDGYQSMKIIYDGTLARWRRLSSIADASQYGITGFGSGPLLSGFDYKSLLTKGFFAGGASLTPGITMNSTVDKIDYSTETRQVTFANTLSQARSDLKAAGNSDKGFFSGGFDNSVDVSRSDKITYSSESLSYVSGANLSIARSQMGAAGNSDKGFFIGGSSGIFYTTADRTTYSTELTAAVSGASLSVSRSDLSAVGNLDKGFFSGGLNPAIVATAERITYSTETTAAVSGANLSQARGASAAAGNSDKGFFAGGYAPSIVATADRTTYASETTAAVSGANLSQARESLGGSGNSDKGFFAGGTTPTVVITSDRTTYSSETTAAVSGANLSQSRYALGSL